MIRDTIKIFKFYNIQKRDSMLKFNKKLKVNRQCLENNYKEKSK